MALDPNTAFTNTNGVAFPNNEAVNASGPTTTDGTEFVKNLIDNYMFGPQQALLSYAGLIPDGSPEAAGTSQEIEAMKRNFSYPGEAVNWYGVNDPATEGARIILLHGQGVLVADYPELVAACYVGDGNNATAPAFYKADDASGTVRNTAGIYFILPDMRKSSPKQKPDGVFAARIANNGTASITSQTGDWLQSVNRTAAGRVTLTYKTNQFSAIPCVVPAAATATVDSIDAQVYNEGIASCEISVWQNDTGTLTDKNFNVFVSNQGDDYNPFGDDFIEPGIRY